TFERTSGEAQPGRVIHGTEVDSRSKEYRVGQVAKGGCSPVVRVHLRFAPVFRAFLPSAGKPWRAAVPTLLSRAIRTRRRPVAMFRRHFQRVHRDQSQFDLPAHPQTRALTGAEFASQGSR